MASGEENTNKQSAGEESMQPEKLQEQAQQETAPGDEQSAITREKDLENELLYLRAEFDNYRKRIIREQEQSIRFANERMVKELLEIVDLLERALSHSEPLKARQDDKEVTNFVTGIEMTYRELIQLFSRFGVEFTGAVGERFDPNRHEAISQKETSEDKADMVLEVLQKGCLFHGRLLKPARVIVGIKQGQ